MVVVVENGPIMTRPGRTTPAGARRSSRRGPPPAARWRSSTGPGVRQAAVSRPHGARSRALGPSN
eukprot:3491928-Pyramimonas_sp.AAC.1